MTLKELALKEYHERNIEFMPLYPAVLLRVLPKQKVTAGGIILSEDAKDKPLYEGIVLRTWADKTIRKNGKVYQLSCPVSVGDHVMFPHWSGEPVPGLDDEEYRLVPARDYFSTVGTQDAGEIVLIVHKEKETLEQALDKLLSGYVESSFVAGELLSELNKEFDIIRKIKTSVTR